MSAVAVTREGSGPEVLLVHGGASPQTTWAGLEALAERWTLALVHRRGYPPSPPFADGRQDFEVDAVDLEDLLDRPVHVVAHSYGGLGALLAVERRPANVRSLTLVEPAHYVDTDHPDVAQFVKLADTFLAEGLDTDPAMLREFLRNAGADVGDGPLPPDVAAGVRRAHRSRSPGEARPAFDLLRQAGIPMLVASGRHHATMEHVCDVLAEELRARRLVVPGAGHFVARAPGFADELDRFLSSVTERD